MNNQDKTSKWLASLFIQTIVTLLVTILLVYFIAPERNSVEPDRTRTNAFMAAVLRMFPNSVKACSITGYSFNVQTVENEKEQWYYVDLTAHDFVYAANNTVFVADVDKVLRDSKKVYPDVTGLYCKGKA